MSNERRAPGEISRTRFLRRALAVLVGVSCPALTALGQTTTTTTTTTSSDGTTTTTQETTTTSSSGTTVYYGANPMGPAGVGGMARRTSRRTARRVSRRH